MDREGADQVIWVRDIQALGQGMRGVSSYAVRLRMPKEGEKLTYLMRMFTMAAEVLFTGSIATRRKETDPL